MFCSSDGPIRPFRFFHIIGGLLALFLALLLSGCSTVRLGYNHGPELGYWWLDSYLDFNDAQAPQVRADLLALQGWHRQQELPRYLRTLEQLQGAAPFDTTPGQVCELLAGLKLRGQTLLTQAEPALTRLAITLSAGQLDHLARQFDKRNQKWQAEWLAGTTSERRARRVKQLAERAELLYGRLEEPQLAVLRAGVAASGFDAAASYRETLRRQQDTLHTLRQLQGGALAPARAAAEVQALLGRALNSPDVAWRQHAQRLNEENCRTWADLHNSSTPAQRHTLAETLGGYASDARALLAPRR